MKFLARLLHFLEDPHCLICGAPLELDEQGVCTNCIIETHLFDTFQLQLPHNPLERRLHGSRIEAASALLSYNKGNIGQQLVHNLKYYNQRKLARLFGRAIAEKITLSPRYQNIDYIIPVPLHPSKRRKRGYNQSELVAHEVARLTHIPLLANQLKRMTNNKSQASLSFHERRLKRIKFELNNPQMFEGKCVLLIDDVFTTGTTILNCAEAFNPVQDMRLLVYSIASPLGH